MALSGFRIATVRGIPIRIHFTFLLVLPLLAFGFARAFQDAAVLARIPPAQLRGHPFVWGLGLALALFLSVLLHELAHSLYALKRGGRVRDITLLMIGGVSQLSEPPREIQHEAIMALVGPVVSLLLGAALYGLHLAAGGTASFNLRFALFYLATLNLFLGAFNLLPAFPMDGGRILRAILARRMGIVQATRVAAGVGTTFAVLFGVWGFFSSNMLLLLVAFFVFIGAESETRSVLVKALIGKLRVRDLMTPQIATVPADVSVYDVAERMLRERRLAFAAMRDGQPIGLVTLEAVQGIPPERRAGTLAQEIAAAIPPLSPSDEAGKALRIMTESELPQLAVSEDGHLVGTITRNDIVRGLKLRELEATQRQGARWPFRRRGELPI